MLTLPSLRPPPQKTCTTSRSVLHSVLMTKILKICYQVSFRFFIKSPRLRVSRKKQTETLGKVMLLNHESRSVEMNPTLTVIITASELLSVRCLWEVNTMLCHVACFTSPTVLKLVEIWTIASHQMSWIINPDLDGPGVIIMSQCH